MRFAFTFLVVAAFIVISHASFSNLAVTTFDNGVCDFSNWNGVTPEYGNTCVRNYKTWTWWTSPYPWCYHSDGSWDYCQDYTWEIEFPEDRHLIENESRRKQYYYDYYQTATTYDDARKICQDRGEGWDLASFQAIPDVDKSASAKDVKEALGPLIQTWDAFWVKNVDTEYDNGEEYLNGVWPAERKPQLAWSRSGSGIGEFANNDGGESSFVCERNSD